MTDFCSLLGWGLVIVTAMIQPDFCNIVETVVVVLREFVGAKTGSVRREPVDEAYSMCYV